MEPHWPVLIIDPDRDAADYVRYALVDGGQDARRVRWTNSLGGARNHLRRGTPRVIVTALPLPDAQDGEVLDTLRQEAPDVPIVGITPSAPPVDTGSRSGGAHAYLSRADVRGRLIDQIRSAIQRCRFERQLRADQAADFDERQAAMVGRIADSTSFEVNNALAIVSAALTRLEADLRGRPAHADALRAARSGVARAGRAVDGLLAAGGRREPVLGAVDLGTLVKDELPRIQRAAGPNVRVETWLVPGIPKVKADPAVLALVLAILAGRAGAAMEDEGELVVRAQASDDEHSVEVLLLDDGAPLHPGQASTQAEFVRARSLVEQSGGTFDLSARWPTGVQVRIRLPAAEDTPHTAPKARGDSPSEQTPTPPTATPVVLVVEDELLLQGLLVRALADHGYRTASASDEEEAREEAARIGHVDVVITDVILPKGDLANMLRDLRRRWPKVAVVAMSGAVREAVGPLAEAGIDAPVLAKPFRLPELFSAVRLALDEMAD